MLSETTRSLFLSRMAFHSTTVSRPSILLRLVRVRVHRHQIEKAYLDMSFMTLTDNMALESWYVDKSNDNGPFENLPVAYTLK